MAVRVKDCPVRPGPRPLHALATTGRRGILNLVFTELSFPLFAIAKRSRHPDTGADWARPYVYKAGPNGGQQKQYIPLLKSHDEAVVFQRNWLTSADAQGAKVCVFNDPASLTDFLEFAMRQSAAGYVMLGLPQVTPDSIDLDELPIGIVVASLRRA
jgi:hypothetical protein